MCQDRTYGARAFVGEAFGVGRPPNGTLSVWVGREGRMPKRQYVRTGWRRGRKVGPLGNNNWGVSPLTVIEETEWANKLKTHKKINRYKDDESSTSHLLSYNLLHNVAAVWHSCLLSLLCDPQAALSLCSIEQIRRTIFWVLYWSKCNQLFATLSPMMCIPYVFFTRYVLEA